MITEAQQKVITDYFRKRCIAQGIKYKSKTYYREQASFFAGAIAVLENEVPPIWFIYCMSNREIIEPYDL